MAEASVSQDRFSCSICLDLLKDPVTIPCGHSYCMSCITDCWDQDDQKRVYSCPQCRQTFSPRPLLCKKRHNLTDATGRLQELICPQHDKLIEIYCQTHKGRKYRQKINEKQKELQNLKALVKSQKRSAQTLVGDIFTELIRSIERSRSEVIKLIRDQEKTAVSRAEGLLKELEQEIDDLRRRDDEVEQLSHTDDHIHFLQSFQSLCVPPGSTASLSITVGSYLSFDDVEKSVSHLNEKLENFCREETEKIYERGIVSFIYSLEFTL
ncbi:E3 ubiquitin-protein ligase TRIM39-like [Triplophysa rosa]|uniref:E3 ubiquitin-protein ligase TRIM39-like n=1 Tax=Triplophysa rosa TaxID=992332 RepID=UPI0025461A1B|nr:E3 ubiquitin-protein ligase TRIM39-like [Triplophysa rosa]